MQKGIVSFYQQFYTSVAALPVSGEEQEENKEVQTREPQAEHCEVSSGHVVGFSAVGTALCSLSPVGALCILIHLKALRNSICIRNLNDQTQISPPAAQSKLASLKK